MLCLIFFVLGDSLGRIWDSRGGGISQEIVGINTDV